jgi:hypothetical protein
MFNDTSVVDMESWVMSVFAVLVLLIVLMLCAALAVAVARGGGWITAGRRLTEVALVLMAVVVVVGGISVIRGWDEPVRIAAVLLDEAVPPVAAALPDGVELLGETSTRVAGEDTAVLVRSARVPVRVVLAEPSPAQRLLALLPAALAIGAIAVGLLILRRLLLRAGDGDPFTAAGVRDLRLLGAVILAGTVAVQFIGFVVSTALVSDSAATDVATAEATFSFAWILAGVLVLALAEIWAAGMRMRDDLAGVV